MECKPSNLLMKIFTPIAEIIGVLIYFAAIIFICYAIYKFASDKYKNEEEWSMLVICCVALFFLLWLSVPILQAFGY